MTPSLTLVRVFDRSWGDWLSGVEACRRKTGRRAVHALRIGSRRLEALLEVLTHTTGAPSKPLRRLRKVATKGLDALSPLRDDQVHRRRIERSGGGRGMTALLDHVRRRQARHKARARKALGHIDLARADTAAQRVRRAVMGGQGTPIPRELTTRLLTVIDGALEDVRRRLARLDLARPRSLHTLRVAIKRCRYIAEIAEEVAPGIIQVPAQPALRALQRRLGAVHDADVLLERIGRFARRTRRRHDDVRAFTAAVESARARQLRQLSKSLSALRDALAELTARAAARAP